VRRGEWVPGWFLDLRRWPQSHIGPRIRSCQKTRQLTQGPNWHRACYGFDSKRVGTYLHKMGGCPNLEHAGL